MSEHEQLIKRIVAEVMKNAVVTTEGEEEDDEVQEEGQGDRKDPRDNNQQGHRQGEGHDGSAGQLQEEDDDDAEVQEEGFEKPKSATGSGPSAKAGKVDRKDVANQVPSGFVNEDEEADGETIEEVDTDDNDETIEESEEEETTDDLQETFRRRQTKLFEKLVRWSKE